MECSNNNFGLDYVNASDDKSKVDLADVDSNGGDSNDGDKVD